MYKYKPIDKELFDAKWEYLENHRGLLQEMPEFQIWWHPYFSVLNKDVGPGTEELLKSAQIANALGYEMLAKQTLLRR